LDILGRAFINFKKTHFEHCKKRVNPFWTISMF